MPTKKSATPKPIGVVTHYYGGIGVAIIRFKRAVKVGEPIAFRGATTDFAATITSMQVNHKDVRSAPKGKEVGIKVRARVREGDEVFTSEA